MTSQCISCGGPSRALGPLPASNFFAGRSRQTVLEGGEMYRCSSCFLSYRYPRPTKADLDALYASGSPVTWEISAPATRADWRRAASVIEAMQQPCSVLDVGCFDGAFLSMLPATADRAGIEIMPDAARLAHEKGVRLLGADFGCLAQHAEKFDVVTAFDVIEHVENPLAFLALLAVAVKAGGVLMLSTGNLDAWTWRLMRNRYWYCAIPEHISFLSERWFHRAAQALELNVRECHRYAHASDGLSRRVREALSNLAFLVSPRVIGALRARGMGQLSHQLSPAIRDSYPPGWLSAADHILVTLGKAS